MRNKTYLFATLLFATALLLGGCDATSPRSVDAGGLVGSGSNLAAAASYPIGSSYPPGLVVTGSGTVETNPDIAYLNLGVDLRSEDAAEVVSDGSSRMEAILDAIKAAGISDEDIRTAGYNLWVENRYDPNTGRQTGEIDYHLSHSVRVTVRDMDQVGTILATAVNAGANNVGQVSFSVEDTEALVAEARNRAVVDARAKAQSLAQALDITLGQIISVSESGGWAPEPYRMDMGGGVLEAAAAVPLPAGSFSVSVSVVLVYELP